MQFGQCFANGYFRVCVWRGGMGGGGHGEWRQSEELLDSDQNDRWRRLTIRWAVSRSLRKHPNIPRCFIAFILTGELHFHSRVTALFSHALTREIITRGSANHAAWNIFQHIFGIIRLTLIEKIIWWRFPGGGSHRGCGSLSNCQHVYVIFLFAL